MRENNEKMREKNLKLERNYKKNNVDYGNRLQINFYSVYSGIKKIQQKDQKKIDEERKKFEKERDELEKKGMNCQKRFF